MIESINTIQKVNGFEHTPKLIFAADAGSRSRGYATPFSDLDVFAIYVRHPDDYLTVNQPKERFFVKDVVAAELADIQLWDLRSVVSRIGKDATVFNALRRASALTAFVNKIPLAVENDFYNIPVDVVGLVHSNLNWKHNDNSFKSVMQHCYVSMMAQYLLNCNKAYHLMPVNIETLVAVSTDTPNGFRSLFLEVLRRGIYNSNEKHSELSYMLYQIDAESRKRVGELTHTSIKESERNAIFRHAIARIWK